MNNLERLKLELSNKQYCTDTEYSILLEENSLKPLEGYTKKDNQIKLLETVVSVLETLTNDIDIMRKIDSKDIVSTDQAIKYLLTRIDSINKKIIDLKEEKDEYVSNNIRPIFYTR
ncbi:hypothetical protein JW813_11455 [Clostridium botulinum]|uniref:Uncharacterized protein n=1 Tax=Clostridium botulinum (strain Eklund 17B / Type B) TaxID=935198 RepID=B2TRL1_CLOBB|nr:MULTISPECIES: hypothetical protein [Clostridium]ACD23410.1 hypothetical protein CLL_A2381 [Clostridium botulinum B str. Eklund 17B (NRP)]MBN1055800.1 hypothetical protein [Clostridium botulinum]MBY6975901.1 hypothetical protein [Clostridium botulinum]MBY7000324.1 hypothetical protein [Clostridium botulinum]MCR1273084.1 hypothetical protein [Clostridium botulinum]